MFVYFNVTISYTSNLDYIIFDSRYLKQMFGRPKCTNACFYFPMKKRIDKDSLEPHESRSSRMGRETCSEILLFFSLFIIEFQSSPFRTTTADFRFSAVNLFFRIHNLVQSYTSLAVYRF